MGNELCSGIGRLELGRANCDSGREKDVWLRVSPEILDVHQFDLEFFNYAEAGQYLASLPDWQIACLVILALAGFALLSAFLRTPLVLIARIFGFYHPNQYRWWPHLPWRSPYSAYLAVKKWYERVFVIGKRSSGGFAGILSMLTLLFKPGQILVGRAYGFGFGWFQPIGIQVRRHLFMYAMTGSSKTTSLISMISVWTNSVFLVDPKNQIVHALAALDWRTWYVLAPYGAPNIKSASFNAIDVLKEAMQRDGADAAVQWALRIAVALIVTPAGVKTPYFYSVARRFLAALILQVITIHPEEDHNLPAIRDLIIHGYRVYEEDGSLMSTVSEAQEFLLRAMQSNDSFGGAISGGVAALESADSETRGNALSTLQDQTNWLDIPQVRAVLRSSSMPHSWLKSRNDVVFAFSAPLFSIREELAPLSRLLTNLLAYTFEAVPEKNGQCLTIIDELPSQGQGDDSVIAAILAAARSMGMTFVGISQNVELMKKCFPKTYKSFVGEADAVLWSGGNHEDNVDQLARNLGKKSQVEKDPYSGRKTYREVPVMDEDQIRRFLDPDSGNLIVTRAGARPLKLKTEYYFNTLPVWRYEPDPDHKESLARRFTRWLLNKRRPDLSTSRTAASDSASNQLFTTEEEKENDHERSFT